MFGSSNKTVRLVRVGVAEHPRDECRFLVSTCSLRVQGQYINVRDH